MWKTKCWRKAETSLCSAWFFSRMCSEVFEVRRHCFRIHLGFDTNVPLLEIRLRLPASNKDFGARPNCSSSIARGLVTFGKTPTSHI